MSCWVMRAAELSGVLLQRALGRLSAAAGSDTSVRATPALPHAYPNPNNSLHGWRGQGTSTHLSCSPVISTSASRSSSAAFFCMVFPIPSMLVLKHDAHNKDIILQRGKCASLARSFNMFLFFFLKRAYKKCENRQRSKGWSQIHTHNHSPLLSPVQYNKEVDLFPPTFDEVFFFFYVTGIKGNTCSQSETPRAQSPRISISRAPVLIPPKPADICTPTPMHRCGSDPAPTLVEPHLCGEARRLSACLSPMLTDTQHGTGARFPPRRCQCPLYKLAALGGLWCRQWGSWPEGRG